MSADTPTTDHTIETSAGPPDGAAAPVPAQGDRVGTYRIESLAGSGGMGVVYRARDEQLDRWVALKLIAPEYGRDPRFREMFLRESRAAAAIEHPNVVPVYRADQDGDRLYIAMRLVDGESLADLIGRRGRIAPAQAARLLGQVAGALEAAHRRGLLHRDVKPANILVSDDEEGGTAFLSDFGLATRFVQDAAGGRWAGTLAYLAPEQIRGGALDARTDVYALGCVLFQALTGRVPFPTRDEQAAQVAHLTQAPPRVSEIAPGVPAGFDAVVARAMAKRPEDRYPSASAFAAALAALRFDTVLVHHPDDAGAAAELRAALRAEGLEVPDPSGPDELADALRASGSCIVLVGAPGLGAWAREALALAQELALRDRSFRLAAALLPRSPDPFGPGMGFLAGRTWADLRLGTGDRDGRRELLRLVREEPPPPADAGPDVNPYRGLAPFGVEDAGFFVGREDEVARLIERLRGRRFLAVVGPSGSGKSSLVAAGLLPALRDAEDVAWRIATLTPGSRPLAALAAAVAGLVPPSSDRPGAGALGTDPTALRRAIEGALPGAGDTRAVLVVDQFEEVFTLAAPDERRAFLDALSDAAILPGGRVWVVAAIRADFYPRCAEHPVLRELVAANQFLVGPMSPAALRRAIEVPARRTGLVLEGGLTKRILNDLAGRPGALPLLQHLLLELWHRRRGRELTLEAYAASGGVEGAVARRADEVFTGLTPPQQAVAREVLMRLTSPGEGTEDTRRRAEMRELVTESDLHAEVDAVVGAFTRARLFTTGRDDASGQPTVEVAHEALIRSWPRLRTWLDEARDRLRAQHRLATATADWESSGRDAGLLYRGARLAEWRERERDGLNTRERDFLSTSEEAAEQELRGRRRRVRTVIAALAAGLVVTGGAGVFALVQRDNAQSERDVARSRQLAAQALSQVQGNPELAVLLAQAAYDESPTDAADAALRTAAFASKVRAAATLPGAATGLAPLAGRRVAVTGADGVLRVWDADGDGPPRDIPGAGAGVTAVAPLGDGRGIVIGREDGAIATMADADAQPRILGRHAGPVAAIAVGPGGAPVVSLAAEGTDGVVRLWAGGRGRVIARAATQRVVGSLAISPDGGVLATSIDPSIGRFALPGGRRLGTTAGVLDTASSLAFTSDGRRLLAATIDGAVQEMPADGSGPLRTRKPNNGRVAAVVTGPGGSEIASAGEDAEVVVRDSATAAVITRLNGHSRPIRALAFTGDGTLLVSASEDGTVRAWDWSAGRPDVIRPASLPNRVADPSTFFMTSDPVFTGDRLRIPTSDGAVHAWSPFSGSPPATTRDGATEQVTAVTALSRDGDGDIQSVFPDFEARRVSAGAPEPSGLPSAFRTDVASASGTAVIGGIDGTVQLWPRGERPRTLVRPEGDQTLEDVSISSDGSLVGATALPSLARLLAPDGAITPLDGIEGDPGPIAVAPDGSGAAVGSSDQAVRVWTAEGGAPRLVLRGHRASVESLEYSGDGRLLLSGANDGLRVWDARTGAPLLSLPAGQAANIASNDDGSLVAAYDFDTDRLQVWRCDVCGAIADVRRIAADRVTRALSATERRQFTVDG